MKFKAIFIFGILVLFIGGAAFLRWGLKTKEITLSHGPVAKVSATDTETILFINPNENDPIRIQDDNGAYDISRNKYFQRLIISAKGIETEDGKPFVKWRNPIRYVPAQSFRVFSRRVYLGRLEMAGGTVNNFYLPKQ